MNFNSFIYLYSIISYLSLIGGKKTYFFIVKSLIKFIFDKTLAQQ
jgi:hypothetical protein